MPSRRKFLQTSGLVAAGTFVYPRSVFAKGYADFVSHRPPVADRKFTSEAVELAIKQMKTFLANKELGWMFENCFPNTLDTTVFFEENNGVPDTYVITGDIDAMWLRDSSAQVWPYLPLAAKDTHLQRLIAGVINRQGKCIIKDPYANAFYRDSNKVSEWKDDLTTMQPGIHERKWEIDSLCYPIRLAYKYWKVTGDTKPFNQQWKESIIATLRTFKEQQRKNGDGPYTFQRKTSWATDGVPLGGYGYPVKPVGLICSMFRASDDATIFPFHIPENMFAVQSLHQAAEMLNTIRQDTKLAGDCGALAAEVASALKKYSTARHRDFGDIYAYEVNGFGSFNIMDDANSPSLLSLPYLGAVPVTDPVYQRTRKLLLSSENPFFFKGTAAQGIGSPHTGKDMIWHLGLIMRALTSTDDAEITQMLKVLQSTHGDTGFMHESFQKDDASKFTRKWFAWANTLFGELLLHLRDMRPELLKAV